MRLALLTIALLLIVAPAAPQFALAKERCQLNQKCYNGCKGRGTSNLSCRLKCRLCYRS
jgi:hypothetical protein